MPSIKFFILFLLSFLTLQSSAQNMGKKYFSYPDKKIFIQIKDSLLSWSSYDSKGNIKRVDLFELREINETLIIYKVFDNSINLMDDSIFIGAKVTIIGNWIDIEFKGGCGTVYRKESMKYSKESKRLSSYYTIENHLLLKQLLNRSMRVAVFNKSCDLPLKSIGQMIL